MARMRRVDRFDDADADEDAAAADELRVCVCANTRGDSDTALPSVPTVNKNSSSATPPYTSCDTTSQAMQLAENSQAMQLAENGPWSKGAGRTREVARQPTAVLLSPALCLGPLGYRFMTTFCDSVALAPSSWPSRSSTLRPPYVQSTP